MATRIIRDRRVASRPHRLAGGLAALASVGTLVACSSGPTAHVAVAMDPAGRLLAVVAVCDGQRLARLTLADETSGTSTTVRVQQSPAFGGTVVLTGPIGDPRPEGVLDLLDRRHEYVLTGATTGADSDEETGTLPGIRFKLEGVVTQKKLREGWVIAPGPEGTVMTERTAFVTQARQACGG